MKKEKTKKQLAIEYAIITIAVLAAYYTIK